MNYLHKLTAISLAAALVACGGGGGGTASTTPTETVAATYSGQFIDAPTKGLVYTASPSGLTGTTDADGTFKFKEGDIVSFSIPTPNGNLDIGRAIPATPSSTNESAILHVTTMDNGQHIAEALQSLGGTGSRIDVSSANTNISSLSSNAVSQIKDYISSGGATTRPAELTVTKEDALVNAMASLANVPAKVNTSQLQTMLSDAVVVHTAVLTFDATKNGSTMTDVKILSTEVTYFKPDGKLYTLCVNSPWIDKNYRSNSGNNCEQTGIFQNSKWNVPTGSTNKFIVTVDAFPTYENTVSFLDINATHGLFTQAQPNAYDNVIKFSGQGEYIFLNKYINKSSVAGTTFISGGNESCSDGVLKFVYSADGSTFTRSCVTATADGSPNTPVTGTITDNLEIPGLLKMSFGDGSQDVYSGVTAGSTQKRGRGVIIVPGNNNCGTANGRSLSNCGGITMRTYWQQ